MTYIRIYNGKLAEGDPIYNVNKKCVEKITRIAIAYSNDYEQVKEISAGNIVVVNGLKDTITGDTLVSHKNTKLKSLPGVEVPDPVFFCSIEPPSMSFQRALDRALANLAREDPSFRVEINEETNDQTILSGMGELHLEVILKRIRQEYKIDADLGPLVVAYKETPQNEAIEEIDFERKIGTQKHHVELTLAVYPMITSQQNSKPTLKFKLANNDLKPFEIKALQNGFSNGLYSGPLLGFPILGAAFEVVMKSGSKIRVRVPLFGFGSSSGCNLRVFIG